MSVLGYWHIANECEYNTNGVIMDIFCGSDMEVTLYGRIRSYHACVMLMDDDIREKLANMECFEYGQDFLNAYCREHFQKYNQIFTLD